MPSTSSGRPSSSAAAVELAGVRELPDARRRDARDERHLAGVEPERAQQVEVAARGRARSGSPSRRRRPACRSRRGSARRTRTGSARPVFGVNSTTSTSSTPHSASSSRRRSSVESSSTWFPSTVRGCGSNVTTVGTRPASTAARMTARCPRWTPSNVPIATARSRARQLVRDARATRHASASTPLRMRSRRRAPGPPAAAARARRRPAAARPPRPSAASSTLERPIAVRRSDVQWPPSACAIARTYVPELTWRSSLTRGRRRRPLGDDLELVDDRAPERHLDRDAARASL